MQARMKREGEVVVVELIGRINYETADPFRHQCMEHLVKEKVVFDLKDLDFVGSSGIRPFIGVMAELLEVNPKGMKLSGVGSEFRRVFEASPIQSIEIYEDNREACQAFTVDQNVSISGVVPQGFPQSDSSEISIEIPQDLSPVEIKEFP